MNILKSNFFWAMAALVTLVLAVYLLFFRNPESSPAPVPTPAEAYADKLEAVAVAAAVEDSLFGLFSRKQAIKDSLHRLEIAGRDRTVKYWKDLASQKAADYRANPTPDNCAAVIAAKDSTIYGLELLNETKGGLITHLDSTVLVQGQYIARQDSLFGVSQATATAAVLRLRITEQALKRERGKRFSVIFGAGVMAGGKGLTYGALTGVGYTFGRF
ncbi:hypothetical protein [Rufibacter quisquiliarum]|uniref:Uncharacterized protein n=1 Tax=Rufibacter quisquiliarum TaxID=1549639 RepID=A0A839GFD1_9BACT|nr:hypothetical protein [Rufibacter quisquiliarum]MBA9078344.1 hypothetical protein [Rufibacter quisquiliarum]